MSSKLPNFNMLDHPEVAQEIGFLIMYCANLDGWILPALTRLLEGKDQVAKAILQPVDNLASKANVLFAIAQASSQTEFRDKIIKSKNSVLNAIKYRNVICHSHYGFTDDDTPRVQIVRGFLSRRRGGFSAEDISIAEIKEHREVLRAIIKEIAMCCGGVYWMDHMI